MRKCRMINTKLWLSKIVTTFPVFEEHCDPNAVITMVDDQGGTLDVELLELFCSCVHVTKTKSQEHSRWRMTVRPKAWERDADSFEAKESKQTARQALAWAAGTLCCSSRAAATVLFICFIFQKKPLLLFCFSFCLLCDGEFWRSFFTCFLFECIFS